MHFDPTDFDFDFGKFRSSLSSFDDEIGSNRFVAVAVGVVHFSVLWPLLSSVCVSLGFSGCGCGTRL